jgi:PKD repeat protein
VVDPTVVPNGTPTARFAVATDGLSVSFDGSLTVDEGPISGWAWDFGNGSTSTAGPVTSVEYAAAGTYLVTLTATDAHGASSRLALHVSVG